MLLDKDEHGPRAVPRSRTTRLPQRERSGPPAGRAALLALPAGQSRRADGGPAQHGQQGQHGARPRRRRRRRRWGHPTAAPAATSASPGGSHGGSHRGSHGGSHGGSLDDTLGGPHGVPLDGSGDGGGPGAARPKKAKKTRNVSTTNTSPRETTPTRRLTPVTPARTPPPQEAARRLPASAACSLTVQLRTTDPRLCFGCWPCFEGRPPNHLSYVTYGHSRGGQQNQPTHKNIRKRTAAVSTETLRLSQYAPPSPARVGGAREKGANQCSLAVSMSPVVG